MEDRSGTELDKVTRFTAPTFAYHALRECNVVAFEKARTGHALVLSYLEEAGFARINLLPSSWRDPGDCLRFLERWRPPIFTGDPVAYQELMRLPLTYRPEALISRLCKGMD